MGSSYEISTARTLDHFLKDNSGSLLRSPEHGFSGSDNPIDYIHHVKNELLKQGELYNSSELQKIQDWLKKAYALSKHKKDPALLSEYRSSLATIGRLRALSEMVEGKNLDEILEEKETDAYQKLILTKTWYSRQKYTDIYSQKGLELVNRTYQKVDVLLEEKAQKSEVLTAGEQKAYTRLKNELRQIENTVAESNVTIISERRKSKEPKNNEPSLISPPQESFFSRVGSYVSNKMTTIAVLLGIGSALVSNNAENKPIPFHLPLPAAYASTSVPYTPPLENTLLEVPAPKPKNLLPNQHETKEGDWLYTIAGKHCHDHDQWKKIADENNVPDPRKLPIGKILTVNCK